MFRWTDDMVRFMRDAVGFGSYQTELAGWICSQIPQARHVCDAGCGTGELSAALRRYCAGVTAVDSSAMAQLTAIIQGSTARAGNSSPRTSTTSSA